MDHMDCLRLAAKAAGSPGSGLGSKTLSLLRLGQYSIRTPQEM